MFSRILFYALAGLVIFQILRSLSRTKLPTGRPRRRPPSPRGPSEEILVRDPQCGIYLPRSAGIRRRIGGEEHYFCSEDCFEAFRAGREA